MRKLILLTNTYPFGAGENFLDTEVGCYTFEKSIIIPLKSEGKSRLYSNGSMEIVESKTISKVMILANAFLDKNLYTEIIKLIKIKKMTVYSLRRLVSFSGYAMAYFHRIKKVVNREYDGSTDSVTIYAYWMHITAYTGALLKKKYPKINVVTRAHGYDLYEYRYKDQYIPMRKNIFENVDRIYCISYDGKEYLENRYPSIQKRVKVSYLGTCDYGGKETQKRNDAFRIVSCSNLIALKRVDIIIDALAKISDFDITWSHFGDGELRKHLEEMAEARLGKNIKYTFYGQVSNKQLMEHYAKNDYDLFINLSKFEGIPVSVMEAISFGIPVCATNVGGTKEIIKDGVNGYLLSDDFIDDDVCMKIREFYSMDDCRYKEFRKQARTIWEKKFNALINYQKFLKELFYD